MEEIPLWYWLIVFFALGACVGSFYNVIVYRMPRGISLINPPSHCPLCKKHIPLYYNLPIIGWLILRGKSACCKQPISIIYPIGESHPIQVVGDEKGFRKALKAGEYKVFTLEVVNIPKETALALCRLADDRGAGRFGWYAHCRGKHMDYNYRKERAREGRRVIDVCTYNGYQS